MSKYRYRLGRHSYETSQTVTAAVLLLPTLIALGFLFIYPVIRVFYLSFTNTNTITNISTWAGLKNFEFLLRNKMFGKAFGNTVWFTIGKLSGEV
ncbi:MAG: sugar ABC transporter permease, partial [Clostridia bacterium]|nr:sugar ABC transporter permease [Clostridia bacterium]